MEYYPDFMITGIDVVFIHAKNPLKLAQWYKETLDLELGFGMPDLSWQEFSFPEGETKTRFALDFAGENPSIVEQQPIIISFKVDDLQKTVAILENKGIQFFGKEIITDVGPTLVATLQDIEGNWIQLSQRK